MNHDESNPSLCTSLSGVRDFFFLIFARLCILSDTHDFGTTPILKGFLFFILFFSRLRVNAVNALIARS